MEGCDCIRVEQGLEIILSLARMATPNASFLRTEISSDATLTSLASLTSTVSGLRNLQGKSMYIIWGPISLVN